MAEIFTFLDWILRILGIGALIKVALEYRLEKKQFLFKTLQSKRGVVIEKLYEKLVLAIKEFKSLLAPFQEAGELPEKEKAKIAAEKGNDFVNYYQLNRIFFSKELTHKIDEFEKGLKEIFLDFKYSNFDSHAWKIKLDAWNKLNEKIDPLKGEIEDEFRKLIGVES